MNKLGNFDLNRIYTGDEEIDMRAITHSCGCNLMHGTQKPCPIGTGLWTKAKQTYARAVETGDWRVYTEAKLKVCRHYGSRPQCLDAYIINMERNSYRMLAFASTYQLELWVEHNDEELASHAIVELGLRANTQPPLPALAVEQAGLGL